LAHQTETERKLKDSLAHQTETERKLKDSLAHQTDLGFKLHKSQCQERVLLYEDRAKIYLDCAQLYKVQASSQILLKTSIRDVALRETESNEAFKKENERLRSEYKNRQTRLNEIEKRSEDTEERKRRYSTFKKKLKYAQRNFDDCTNELDKACGALADAEETLKAVRKEEDRGRIQATKELVNNLKTEKAKVEYNVDKAEKDKEALQDEGEALGFKTDFQEDSDLESSERTDSQYATSPPGLSEDRSTWLSSSPPCSPSEHSLLAKGLPSAIDDMLIAPDPWTPMPRPPDTSKVKGKSSIRTNAWRPEKKKSEI
jgi:hypothetical protein